MHLNSQSPKFVHFFSSMIDVLDEQVSLSHTISLPDALLIPMNIKNSLERKHKSYSGQCRVTKEKHTHFYLDISDIAWLAYLAI